MAKTVKIVKKKPAPKGAVRNFYLHGYLGETQADLTIDPKFVISQGPWHAMGGFDLDISQRISRLAGGGELIVRIEGRAYLNGKLTLRIVDVKSGKVIYRNVSWRDGVSTEKEEV